MSNAIQAIRGMNDVLPPQTRYWSFLENSLKELVASYGYQEIRFPVLEQTALFQRSIGEGTDIVEKEMYTFADRNGLSLTLRPEGTAVCVRAALEHGLLYNQIQRLWYLGPMYRHERPQKGRYRQFHHFGVEAFGMAGSEIDAEMLFISARLWEILGLKPHLSLQLNSLGNTASRSRYREQLVAYFSAHMDLLDEDSRRRLVINPLRILDSKNPDLQELIAKAPALPDYLDEESREHFNRLRHLLDQAGVAYQLNPRLVRGLDYYNGLVFEWVTDQLGAQNAVCSGGRYDGLAELLGGQASPAVGFAVGLERVIALLEMQMPLPESPLCYLIAVGDLALERGLILAEQWRRQVPGLRLVVNCGGGSFKAQFKRADKSGADLALILGEDELAKQEIGVKYLREDRPQATLRFTEVQDFLRKSI